MPEVVWLLLIVGPEGPVPAGAIYTQVMCEALAQAVRDGGGFPAFCLRVVAGVPL